MTQIILSAFLPVFVVIALGYGVRASGYVPRELWRGVNALNHRLLLPSFLFTLLARAQFDGGSSLMIGGVSALGSAIMIVLALGLGRLVSVSGRITAPMIATAVMWNIVLTLALADRLLGDGIASAGAAVSATGVIIGAAATVAGFALTSDRGLKAALSKTARDPVVLACVLGLLANLSGLGRIAFLTAPIEMIGAGSMAVILLSMGAGLDFKALKGRLTMLVSAAMLRTVIGPVVYLGLALVFGLSGDLAVLMAIAGAAPAAAFIYAVAADFDGEAGLTAGMITLTVLTSLITLPVAAAIALSL
jgi:hypothetical protein